MAVKKRTCRQHQPVLTLVFMALASHRIYPALALVPSGMPTTKMPSRKSRNAHKPPLYEFSKLNDDYGVGAMKKHMASLMLAASVCIVPVIFNPSLVFAATLDEGIEQQGISAVTQSELGKSIRRQVVGGAKVVDQLDLKWERFSDSLRDEAKCDPRTNRRMFDNGFRRDGTRIGNPVLGELCTPEPLQDLDASVAAVVIDSGVEAAQKTWLVDQSTILKKQEQVRQLVGPSFSRATTSSTSSEASKEDKELQATKRQMFNQDLYIDMRAIGEGFVNSKNKETALQFERAWGDILLTKLASNANRESYSSIFPKPEDTELQSYDEGALLDALGSVSVALNKLQAAGMVGHWEISIPEDDDWNVVTIAVDDDISIGGQILGRERYQALSGSEVITLVRAAMSKHAKDIPYKMDSFFIDPTTTKQELYNPTQLLISLSDLGQ